MTQLISILIHITMDNGGEKDPFKKFNMVRKTLAALQEEQLKEFKKAKSLLDGGDLKRGIFLLEKIVYEDGLHVKDSIWVLFLGKVYLQHKMKDQLEQFIKFMNKKYPQFKSEIKALANRKEQNQ